MLFPTTVQFPNILLLLRELLLTNSREIGTNIGILYWLVKAKQGVISYVNSKFVK